MVNKWRMVLSLPFGYRTVACLALFAMLGGQLRSEDLLDTPAVQESSTGIRHEVLAFGPRTYQRDAQGKVVWRYEGSTRDGWRLANGHTLLAISKSDRYPHGAAVELDRQGGQVMWFEGTQSEVNTVQAIEPDRYLISEAGTSPRLLEIDRSGTILATIPLEAQTADHHLQSRMARKQEDGTYLVPQLLDFVVRQYRSDGSRVWEAKTPSEPPECWPFTAIRTASGHTLATCTHGNIVVEFDREGKVFWQLSNNDLPEPLLVDPCGAQRLANGNTVIASYGQGKPGAVKLLEVTPEKRLVWTYRDPLPHGIHTFQILDEGFQAPVRK
jgi:hypothetical protein